MNTAHASTVKFHVSANRDSSSLVVEGNKFIGPPVSERLVAVKASFLCTKAMKQISIIQLGYSKMVHCPFKNSWPVGHLTVSRAINHGALTRSCVFSSPLFVSSLRDPIIWHSQTFRLLF